MHVNIQYFAKLKKIIGAVQGYLKLLRTYGGSVSAPTALQKVIPIFLDKKMGVTEVLPLKCKIVVIVLLW